MMEKINHLIYDKIYEYRKKDCTGCSYHSLSQRHHTCLNTQFDEFNYWNAIADLLDQKIISRQQFGILTQYNYHTFENGTSSDRFIQD